MIKRVGIMPIHIVIASPLQDRPTGELRAVVTDYAGGLSVDAHQRIQFSGHSGTSDAGVSHQTQVLTATIIVHSQHAELARRTKCIGHKIQ